MGGRLCVPGLCGSSLVAACVGTSGEGNVPLRRKRVRVMGAAFVTPPLVQGDNCEIHGNSIAFLRADVVFRMLGEGGRFPCEVCRLGRLLR